jgi:hypothetical protein
VEITDLAHRGNLQDAVDFPTFFSGGRRSDLYGRLRDRLSGAFEEDDRCCSAATERAADHLGDVAVESDAATDTTPLRFLASDERHRSRVAAPCAAAPQQLFDDSDRPSAYKLHGTCVLP